jgi:hypothetical protein
VQDVEPQSVVLTWPTLPDGGDVGGSICNVTNFFASRETAEKYASAHKGVTVLTPDEVREIFEVLAERSGIPIS